MQRPEPEPLKITVVDAPDNISGPVTFREVLAFNRRWTNHDRERIAEHAERIGITSWVGVPSQTYCHGQGAGGREMYVARGRLQFPPAWAPANAIAYGDDGWSYLPLSTVRESGPHSSPAADPERDTCPSCFMQLLPSGYCPSGCNP